jgi:uncharacterized protein (DUF2235 family)
MPRNLISLIDGTMVSAARTDAYKSYSNVFELACLLQLTDRSEDGSPQIVFYTSGISSQPDNSNVFNLMTGNSIKSQIVDQYTNICANFDFDTIKDGGPQDKIYLFGFSRGAMAVRALAGLIAEFGLLHPTHIRHLPRLLDAWDRTKGRGSLPDDIKLHPVEIEFVGVFDSVMGGIEWMRLFNPIRFNNSRMPGRVRNAVQILAIDENRSLFKPRQWEKAEPGVDANGHATRPPFLRQIWMPGVHSDVGGTGDPLWGRASLLAMAFYLDKRTHLRLNRDWIARKEANLRESFDGPFHIRRHRGFFTSHVRLPIDEGCAKERAHPVCDGLSTMNYDGRKDFDWRNEIFSRHFENLQTDKDLVDYFRRVLRPRATPKPRKVPAAPAAADQREQEPRLAVG